MNQTGHILRAMAMLEEFTVADLVEVCNAPPATVRTVLRRNESLIEPVGQRETGRPGGRWKQYRLRDEARAAALDPTLASPPVQEPGTATPPGGVPTSLLAAEELLLDPATARTDERERASLLRRARRFRQEGEADGSEATDAAQGHRHAVDALIGLVEGEGAEDRASLARARELAVTARLRLHEHNPLNEALAERIDDSPLRDLPPEPTYRVSRKPRRSTRVYVRVRPTGRGIAMKARARAEARAIIKTKMAAFGQEREVQIPVITGLRKKAMLRASKFDALAPAERSEDHDLVERKL